MAEYTWDDIIIDPKDPRLEIRAEYFYGGTPKRCLYHAYSGINIATYSGVYDDGAYDTFLIDPKECSGDSSCACLIRKKEPEKKYVPFDLSKEEVREKLRNRWVKSNKDSSLFEFQITQFSIVNIFNIDIAVINTPALTIYPEDLLKDYIFIDDNTPCGELVDINSDDGLPEGENDN